ncbi:hypothetical protein FHR75_001836 [Kineococcus radiotolerans]|uniref:Uncharacterized protein n=2 Tax=Kineococcus radiotolerans TaxID=131568 RepID=A6W4R9_KINRD|nr:hypothetical protein [Kineococcus radiotolerans]ABS01808.1 hypothetical protein Krad_0318 [Kineococcus radiotolerans SRS30216 = ATCC BAA-149]MBB2901048.1 hypothetical protein [Kineococcus radiotolerans]
MHYSLVSSPVLGFDLVRLPAGDSAAEVLLRALDCGPREIDVLAARHDPATRTAAWDAVRTACDGVPQLTDVLHQVANGLARDDFADEVSGARVERGVVRVLQTSTIADADALVRLVHHDVFDWTWSAPLEGGPRLRTEDAGRAADVLADAAVSAYLGDRLPDHARRVLAHPYLQACRDLAPLPERPTGLGEAQAGVERVLDRLRRLDGTDRACLRAVAAASRPGAGEWAGAVHDASWAVHLSDRVRTAAVAQLLAVRAFRAGGLDAADGAEGLWNVVSGVVHAEVVADLLSSDARAVLLRPWEAAFGPA